VEGRNTRVFSGSKRRSCRNSGATSFPRVWCFWSRWLGGVFSLEWGGQTSKSRSREPCVVFLNKTLPSDQWVYMQSYSAYSGSDPKVKAAKGQTQHEGRDASLLIPLVTMASAGSSEDTVSSAEATFTSLKGNPGNNPRGRGVMGKKLEGSLGFCSVTKTFHSFSPRVPRFWPSPWLPPSPGLEVTPGLCLWSSRNWWGSAVGSGPVKGEATTKESRKGN
jgi:hypothetical protein